jgi:hypothetical protein
MEVVAVVLIVLAGLAWVVTVNYKQPVPVVVEEESTEE